jgi:uncharacterized membrane protein YgdD (TMEM256/DUF423 family)
MLTNAGAAVISILLVLASLMGAGGVGLAAAAAHAAPASGLEGAAYLMLLHAVAVLGGASLTAQKLLWQPLGLIAVASFVVGSALFAGDISMRAFAGHRLFPMAAPTGGMLLILGWLVLAAASMAAVGRSR